MLGNHLLVLLSTYKAWMCKCSLNEWVIYLFCLWKRNCYEESFGLPRVKERT